MNRYTPTANAPTSLPIIDIAPFLNPSSSPASRKETASTINRACIDYGFFYLTGHGIPTPKLDQIISLARQFFSLPLSEKNKIKRHAAGGPEGGDGARGYQSMGENVTQGKRDMHEAIDLYREWDHAEKKVGSGGPGTHKTLQGPNLWPEQPAELKDVYLDYLTQLQHVGQALVRAMGHALDLPPPSPNATRTSEDADIFVRNTTHSFWVLRLIGYPPLSTPASSSTDPSELSCGTHTDYGCVTLLLADPTPGALQVQLKDNTTWLAADPLPGAFVVNIGDMVERWTGGLWKSTRHRVVHRGEGYRVSVPFFYEPDFEARVRPLARCVERVGGEAGAGGEAKMYEERVYGEHLLGKVFGNFV
ncbi:hypothetical protein BDV95DRAFT_592636 [Massariosphaeria phaeospora]|uniref:Fe2OG dioxygenase domain-containing protein n=1 Tax=Massariosphaeria phaeospora TaxID=100035 RepID=A0A7C8ICG9_9PLEO|nr:hypothetical protein BDV95DRAFT_592636 [Massariosphaeria phaeospora]